MKMHALLGRVSAVVLLPVLVGCSTPGARVRSSAVVGTVAETLPKADGLDQQTRELLSREGLLATFRRDPSDAVRQLHQRWSGDLDESRRAGLASVCSAAAGRSDPAVAPGFHLAAAEFAWPLAIADPTSDARRRCRAIHSNSSGELAEHLFGVGGPDAFGTRRETGFKGPLRDYQLRVVEPGSKRVNIREFDTLVRADRLELRKMKVERHRVDGLGSEMVLHLEQTPARLEVNPLIGPAGMALPINANLVFGRAGNRVDLVFSDLTRTRTVRHGGRKLPLSADFTAPLAVLLNHSEIASVLYGVKAMVRTTDYEKQTGIYQLEPWREDQIPVILVHGLASSPTTWLPIVNEISADPVLQERYQILAYRYPTGYPIGRNAATFRRHLREMREQLGPAGRNQNMQRMILVGHSMGGILSNLQLRSSGEEMRKLVFDRPLDEVELSDEHREQLEEMAHFDPDPNIRCAVFIASPHRGSKIAGNALGRFGSRLIRLPLDVLTLGQADEEIHGVTDLGSRMLHERNDSIKTLDDNNPILSAALRLPLGKGVRYHSIIGRKNPKDPLAESSDGFVTYPSSHLDDATSEKVVKATHTSILRDDMAIEELRRILYLHAGLSYSPPRREP